MLGATIEIKKKKCVLSYMHVTWHYVLVWLQAMNYRCGWR